MPPILVPSSAKRIATQILVIAKLNQRKRFYFESFLFVILFVRARNYLFRVSNLRTKIRCESCLVLRMSILTIFNINDVNGVDLVSLLLTKRISNFVLILDFEQVNLCLVHIEKENIFEDKIGHIMNALCIILSVNKIS